MSNLAERVARWSAGRRLVVLVPVFVALLWLISFSPFAFSEASIAQAYGTGTLDLQLGADAAAARATLDQLGEAGRAAYDGFQAVDLLFPLSYALALSGLVWTTWRGDRHRWVRHLAAVPLVGAGLDYLENVLVRVALSTYPGTSDAVLTAGTTVTTAKLLLSYLSQGLVVVGLVLVAVRLALARRPVGTGRRA